MAHVNSREACPPDYGTLLDADKPLVATIAKRGTGLIAEVKRGSACELWEVARANRDALVFDVLEWVRPRLEMISGSESRT